VLYIKPSALINNAVLSEFIEQGERAYAESLIETRP
jgi:hypothetical protein